MKRATALKREFPAAYRIPYVAHVSPKVIRTAAGDCVQVFKVDGASFESTDDEVLLNWQQRLNVLWRNIASPNVALWAQIVRRRERTVPTGGKGSRFADGLAARYRQRLAAETLMVNELYLSLIYRPTVGVASGWAANLLRNANSEAQAASLYALG